MTAYYNEHDAHAAAWLRNLIAAGEIAPGDVDERDIQDVEPADLVGYTQCHFFAGIGGWSLALRLAGWPDDRPVWTGSCPCQPFSAAGARKGHADERHLWPDFLRLITACRPATIFGEQVASAEVLGTDLEAAFVDAVSRGRHATANRLAKRLVRSKGFHFHARWFDGIRTDLENIGYTGRANDLPAASVDAPHIRQRLWWVADAEYTKRRPKCEPGQDELDWAHAGRPQTRCKPGTRREVYGLDHTSRTGLPERGSDRRVQRAAVGAHAGQTAECASDTGGLGDPDNDRCERRGLTEHGDFERPSRPEPDRPSAWRPWDGAVWLPCGDGKARRIEPGLEPLAHGVPNRVGRLRGYGNAIVSQVAATFNRAYLDVTREAVSA